MHSMTVQPSRDGMLSGVGRWVAILVLLLLAEAALPPLAEAQGRADSLNLIPRYRMARYRLLAQQFVAQMPMRVHPPEPLPVFADSILGPSTTPSDTTLAPKEEKRPAFPIENLHVVSDLERSWFRNRYGNTDWAFLGSGPRLTILDTTRTRDLRARLQAHFGAPTYTPAEANLNQWRRRPDSSRKDLVQFAYWYVVNDSIPVRVTDVNGPTERGLIVSTARKYRDRLLGLRNTLLHPLRREKRAPYVDYYYDEETRRWYRVGFDGDAFFREHISRRDIVRGQRPQLETVRPAPASPSGSSS